MLPSFSWLSRTLVVPGLGILLCALGSGCAEERAPINKVQSDALAKSFFVGNPGDPSDDPAFFFRNFTVDGSEAQELIGIGDGSGVDRIKWEVSESMLFGRRAYSEGGGDDKGVGSDFPDGTIVAAYAIVAHFDIRRAYNPQTGEELNVIEENTTDRPWYERDHFRVDWSVNQVDSPQWTDMFIGKLFGDIELTPVAYYVSDPSHDDAPHFDAEAGYFDVTSKFLVAPLGSDEYPGLPQCLILGFVTGTATYGCDAQEAVVRSSYWRVDRADPDDDFEPFENTRAQLDVIANPGGLGGSAWTGILTPPRLQWDPAYGYVDRGMKKLMHKHDIWEQSHQTLGSCRVNADCEGLTRRAGSVCLPSKACTMPCSYAGQGDFDGGNPGGPNGTDDQCENRSTGYSGSSGSQCSARNRCTIPYRDRDVSPVPWWINRETPDALQDTLDRSGRVVKRGPTEDVVYTWNQALKLAVARAREVECRRTGGGDRATCHDQYFELDPDTGRDALDMVSYGGWGIPRVKDDADVLVTCHNPVRDYDPEVCGERNATARVGDMRHRFLFYWPYASQAPWGGIGNWRADPLTGQIVGGAATTMGRSATLAAAQVRDVLLVANGDLDIDDITDGVPASRFQQRLRFGETRTAIPLADLEQKVRRFDVASAQAAFAFELEGETVAARTLSAIEVRRMTTTDPALLAPAYAEVDARASKVRGTELEAQLVNGSWLVDAAGLSPSTPLSPSTLAAVSPFGGRDSGRLNLSTSAFLQRLSSHGVCLFAPGEGVGNPDVRGLARYFADPAIGIYRDDEIRRLEGEMPPEAYPARRAELIYEHLWKETYKGIALHELGHALGMLHNFASSYDAKNFNPQYWQLRTNEGQATASCEGVPRADGQDTCMGPRFLDPETPDELGQAEEPRPGINYFGSTSTMEYQNERSFESVGLGQFDVMTMGALYGRVLETFDDTAPDGVDQGNQQRFTWLSLSHLIESNLVDDGGIRPMHYTELARQMKVFDPARCRDATAEERAQAEWRIVHGKVCAPPPKDIAAWQDFLDQDAPKIIVSPDAPGGTNNVRWPYRYGETNNAYTHINPSDAGADAYEITRETIRKFDYSYPFNYFRRQRRDWNYEALPSLTAGRFFERLRSYHWILSRNLALAGSIDPDAPPPTDDESRAELLAEVEMFDTLTRAILTPQIGAFDRNAGIQRGSPLYDVTNGRGLFTLDASTARFVDPDYDSGPLGGGSWEYGSWLRHAGFYVEKADALRTLADGRPNLVTIQRETYLDGRRLYIGFRNGFATGVDRLLGGVLSGDWASVAPHVTDVNDPVPESLDLNATTPTRPTGAFVLFPNLGYQQQLAGLIWAHLLAGQGTDLSLANKLRIMLEGGDELIALPDDQKQKFSDPRSGFTYVARRYGPDNVAGRTVDKGIGSRMLARANELLALTYEVERDLAGDPVADPYGRPVLVLDASGQPIATGSSGVQLQLSEHVGLLDAAVQVARLVGHGPL